ncbi:hypothetical protein PHLH8_20610 [Pseudomonas sp. Pc102]|uniref:hypothetical protein n=1 Tax=Pseudomonas sp. Pc102 TaxID=2678261 RepID=UPI001BD04B32|nr:hypothetical protein [Pseudomonas sp. Pc102]BBP82419.1 hypothetical protein PHLH8_20610 [Pseudomonas sp. Pc102]
MSNGKDEAFEKAYASVVENGWTNVKHMARQVWDMASATPPAAQVQGEQQAGDLEAVALEHVKDAYYERESITEAVAAIVAQHERIVAARSCPCQTDTARETRRKDAAEAVELQRILFEQHQGCRPLDAGLMGWAAAALSAPPAAEETAHQIRLLATALGECIEAAGITTPGAAMSGPQLLMFADDLKQMLAAPPAAGVPEGYRWYLVPKEDTEAFNAACSAANDAYLGGVGPCGVFIAGYRAMLAAAPTPPASEQQQAVFAIPDMDEHLLQILGRPNFRCSHIAQVLRLGGTEINRKSENEQAAVIHWMLTLYLAHGAAWWEVAAEEIKRIQSEQPAAPSQGESE